ILTNILTNAIRYSVRKKIILFELFANNNHAVFTVKDQGIGIPKADMGNVFEPFHRGKNVSNIPGTGLGLNIVKRFIDFLDGEIDIYSVIEQGTTVKIQLPIYV
ncbi:MAG: sensor histidine kinase, partial [Cyanobacteria bacterium J06631_2]